MKYKVIFRIAGRCDEIMVKNCKSKAEAVEKVKNSFLTLQCIEYTTDKEINHTVKKLEDIFGMNK